MHIEELNENTSINIRSYSFKNYKDNLNAEHILATSLASSKINLY